MAATINGIAIKGVKTRKGHEGEQLTEGNIYLGPKKIGSWYDNDFGGPTDICLLQSYSLGKLNDILSRLNPDRKTQYGSVSFSYCLEFLISDLLELNDYEKRFKKSIKNYAGLLVLTDGYHEFYWNILNEYKDLSKEKVLKEYESSIQETKKKLFEESERVKHKIYLFMTYDDFKFGEPVDLNEIKI